MIHTSEPNLSDEIDLIEISNGSNINYEMDFKAHKLSVDRKSSFTSMCYPYNYGFVPNTEDSTGDPVDVFVVSKNPNHNINTQIEKQLTSSNGVEGLIM